MAKRQDLSNVDVAVYSLALLGGGERSVYSERLAAKCFELAPTHFGWRLEEFRDRGWPDKYVAKTALEDAKTKGALVEGAYALDTAKDGWRLTAAGARWYHDNSDRIERALGIVPVSSLPKKEAERFLRQMRERPMFSRFVKTGQIDTGNVYAFTDMLTCSPDAPPEVIASKFRRLATRAELVKDEAVSAFLRACESAFGSFLNATPKGK